MKRDIGRFHILGWGGGQITLPKELVPSIPWKNKDKLFLELEDGVLRISRLN